MQQNIGTVFMLTGQRKVLIYVYVNIPSSSEVKDPIFKHEKPAAGRGVINTVQVLQILFSKSFAQARTI